MRKTVCVMHKRGKGGWNSKTLGKGARQCCEEAIVREHDSRGPSSALVARLSCLIRDKSRTICISTTAYQYSV
jgi:hypothetical protein